MSQSRPTINWVGEGVSCPRQGDCSTNSLDNNARAITAFAGLVCRLSGLFVDLLSRTMAVGANVLTGAGGARFGVIVGRVVTFWIL